MYNQTKKAIKKKQGRLQNLEHIVDILFS